MEAASSSLAWLTQSIRMKAPVRELEVGECLFRQGDAATASFLVEQGCMQLIRHSVDDRAVPLHTAIAGELFAEAALFADTYHCDAIALTRTRVRVLAKRQLRSAFRADPSLAERYMAVLAREVQRLRSALETRNIRSARARVLHHLAVTAESGNRAIPLTGTLKELAAELGLTHEALYRTLARLEREGAVSRTRSRLVLRKGKRL